MDKSSLTSCSYLESIPHGGNVSATVHCPVGVYLSIEVAYIKTDISPALIELSRCSFISLYPIYPTKIFARFHGEKC